MKRLLPVALAVALAPLTALAAGDTPPAETPTTTDCPVGQIWDAGTKTCIDPRDTRLDDKTRLDAARELARFGRPKDALLVLETLTQPNTPDALTVRGYAARKAGHFSEGRALYARALELSPDNWQARSYLGQALVESGDRAGAAAQLRHIRESGGRGTWPEIALDRALGGVESY